MTNRTRITKTGNAWKVTHTHGTRHITDIVGTYQQAQELAARIAKTNATQHEITTTVDDIARAARQESPNSTNNTRRAHTRRDEHEALTLDYEDADDTSAATRQGKLWQQWELDYTRHAIERGHDLNLICKVLERNETAVNHKINAIKREDAANEQHKRVTRARWTADEHSYLIISTKAGATVEEQAETLGRTTEAIRRRRRDIQHEINKQQH